MREFDFFEPASVEQAVSMLQNLGDEARVMAGGTALILALRQRMLSPKALVSLGKLTQLRNIDFDAQGVRIGAMARHADIARSALVQQHYPVLAGMAARVANPQVRNQGTLGGNLCYADPATDPSACLLCFDAQVVVQGPQGERVMPLSEFVVDYFTTALEPGEVLTEVRLPPPPAQGVGRYHRHLRTRAEHRPLVNVTFLAQRERGMCMNPRLSIGASTAVPLRLPAVEQFLHGKAITLDVAALAAQQAAALIEPISDLRGDAAYRRDVAEVVVRRTIAETFDLDWKGFAG